MDNVIPVELENAVDNSPSDLSQNRNPSEHAQYNSVHYSNSYPSTSEHAQYDDGPTEHAQCSYHMVTEEAETLFNELMDSTPHVMLKKESSTDLDWGDRSLRNAFTQEDMQQLQDGFSPRSNGDTEHQRLARGSSVDEESSTPRASPYTSPSTIRRWSVQKRRSYDLNDPDDSTPKASPFIRRHQSNVTEAEANEEEVVFVAPILDPPTPFRSPCSAEALLPCPDEDLELSELDSLEPPLSDQDTTTSSDPELPPPLCSPPDEQVAAKRKAKTLPPNTSFEDLISSSKIGKLKAESANSIRRCRSFGNRAKILHKREGSISTDNSPLPSPIFSKKGRGLKDASPNASRHHHTSSNSRGSPAPTVSVVGLISTTRTTPELQDIPLIQVDPTASREGGGSTILSPPTGFEGSPERCDSRASSVSREGVNIEREPVEKEERSLRSFLRLKPKKKISRSNTPCDLAIDDHRADLERSPSPGPSHTPATPSTPTTAPPSISMVESHPNEMISFEDALDTYDRYSSETGKTARSCRQEAVAEKEALTPTLDTKKMKGKRNKKRHGYTVANIDAETMREVKRMAEGGERGARQTSDSNVHQLARAYSRKIKDRSSQMAQLEESDPASQYAVKPVWLTDLQERRQYSGGKHSSLEDILNRVRDEDTGSTSSGFLNGEEIQILGTENGSQAQGASAMRKSRTMDGKSNRGLLFDGVEFKEKAGEEEGQKKRRFKGWVKSLAAKFGRKDGTTL